MNTRYLKGIKKLISSKFIHIILLIIITFFAYSNILGNGFAWDDRDFIIDWPSIKSVYYLPELLSGEIPDNHKGVYRPVRSVIYLIDYHLWGENPLGYHLQAILVHIFITVLVYLIIDQITKKKFLALLSAILFATHPIHTEAVTYASASMDTIGIAFFFISFYFFLRSEEDKVKKISHKILSLIYAFLAFFTYEITITLPFLFILYDYINKKLEIRDFYKRFGLIYKNYFSILVFYLTIRELVFLIGDRSVHLGETLLIASHQARIGTMEILLLYLKLLIAPINLSISHPLPDFLLFKLIYPLSLQEKYIYLVNLIAGVDFLIPIIITLTLTVFLIRIFKDVPIIAFGAAWLFISLLPAANILPQGATIAERFLYIPSFGFSLILGLIFYRFFSILTQKRIIYAPLMLITLLFVGTLFFYTSTTINRNADWKNEKSIWLSILKKDPDYTLANGALGLVYFKNGEYGKAIDSYKKSIAADNNKINLYVNLAQAYQKNGEIDQTIQTYQDLIKMNPLYPEPYLQLAQIYAQQGKTTEAIEKYQATSKISIDKTMVHYNLGILYEKSNQPEKALSEYKLSLRLSPLLGQPYNNIGIIYAKEGKMDEAINAFNQAFELSPQNPNTIFNLGLAYEKKGDKPQAIDWYKRGLLIAPNQPYIRAKLNALLDL